MNDQIKQQLKQDYRYGFTTDIATERFNQGLNEEVIRALSAKKQEPDFLLAWRLDAYHAWLKMSEPRWGNLKLQPIDYQAISYYAAPKGTNERPKSLSEVDPKLLATYEKLGIPLYEQEKLTGIAVDAVFDSVSVATTFKTQLEKIGVIFCPFSEAVQKYPELIRQYLGSVVSNTDNFFAALNAAVFSEGSFVYLPKGVKCPMELSTYFRINAANTGQFERTLVIADEESEVSYLEGCTAPVRHEHQLHAAVVELIALKGAKIKYSTVQNWYPGDEEGRGGVYNLVTKRGECRGDYAVINWTQVETGSAVTWKYPSTILRGDYTSSEFYSVAVSNHYQQADTGSNMLHLGKHTRSTVISKGISAGHGQNTYRGLIKAVGEEARNYTQCDSLLIGHQCGAHTLPVLMAENPTANLEHEASTTKISEEQLFYCQQRGISQAQALTMIVHGFCKEVFQKLPMEFAIEAYKLIEVTLEGISNA